MESNQHGPDLCPECLQKLSAKDRGRQRDHSQAKNIYVFPVSVGKKIGRVHWINILFHHIFI